MSEEKNIAMVQRDICFVDSGKSYSDFFDELSAEDVFEGLLGWGLFGDKIPPVLSSESFYKCRSKKSDPPEQCWRGWVLYRYTRNTNHFREFDIPNPFAYEALVRHIVKHWEEIKML